MDVHTHTGTHTCVCEPVCVFSKWLSGVYVTPGEWLVSVRRSSSHPAGLAAIFSCWFSHTASLCFPSSIYPSLLSPPPSQLLSFLLCITGQTTHVLLMFERGEKDNSLEDLFIFFGFEHLPKPRHAAPGPVTALH